MLLVFYVTTCKPRIVLTLINDQHHYNIPDTECTGPFGTCTQNDKLRLGHAAIKRLHEKMDEDKDGAIEVQETKDVGIYFLCDSLFFWLT